MRHLPHDIIGPVVCKSGRLRGKEGVCVRERVEGREVERRREKRREGRDLERKLNGLEAKFTVKAR